MTSGVTPSLRWDRLGIWASAACAVHCFAAPLLFLLVPTLAGIWAHPASHVLIALLVLPLAGTVLLRGYRVHRRRWILTTTVLGGLAILVGCVLPYVSFGEVASAASHTECCPHVAADAQGGLGFRLPPASIVTILGSVLLVVSHAGNLICGRRCRSEACGCEPVDSPVARDQQQTTVPPGVGRPADAPIAPIPLRRAKSS